MPEGDIPAAGRFGQTPMSTERGTVLEGRPI